MAEDMFEGFDHTRFRDEVEERWGKDAYASSDAWWRSLSDDDRRVWKAGLEKLNHAWISAAGQEGADPASPEAQEMARRHVEWLSGVPGTPSGDFDAYVLGLADMYVADSRFAANYGGSEGARFVRDALHAFIGRDATGA